MARDDPLSRFVDRALSSGQPREEVREVLLRAGWTEREIDDALSAFAAVDFPVPVPRPGGVVAARDFLFYGILFVSLSISAIYAVDLAHDLLRIWLDPDARQEWRRRDVDWSLAALIVFGPVYLWCDRRDRKRGDESDRALVRRWMASAVVLAAVLVLLGIAVWVVRALIGGGPTILFLLEAMVVAVVAGLVLWRWRRA
jgi:hypothetical protein